jgi:hypothetical protein
VPDAKVSITYAAEPPATREEALNLPRLSFEAVIPTAAQGLDPFVAATHLTLDEQVKPVLASANLKVGDAVTRTLTMRGDGVPAMLLPPPALSAPDGIAIYRDQPMLRDNVDPQTGAVVGTRIDRATYMLENPGSYTLPPVTLAWWNLSDKKIERAEIPAITLAVAAGTGAPDASNGENARPVMPQWRRLLQGLVQHWPSALLTVGALVALAWLGPRATRFARIQLHRRREAYRQSEVAAFESLREALRGHDAARSHAALLSWLARFEPAGPDNTVAAFCSKANDPELDRELALLEAELFAGRRFAPARTWSSHHLDHLLRVARHRLLRSNASKGRVTELAPLNPSDMRTATSAWHRPVAR